jgi:hypothetical protein
MCLAGGVHDLDDHHVTVEFLFPYPVGGTYGVPRIGRCGPLS